MLGNVKESSVLRRTGRRALFTLGLICSICWLGTCDASAYPDRPITIIVPFAAGGAIDVITRILSEPLAKSLGQPVVVENRTGAGGNIGMGAAARARPDGYTLLMSTSSFTINPGLFESIPYDPIKDFKPIADLLYAPCVIVVRPGLGMPKLSDLLSYARANPGKLNYATPGTGTMPHLSMELLKLRAKANIVHIPYPGGSQSVHALLGGSVESAALSPATVLPLIQGNKIAALAVTGRGRWSALPNVPSVNELGYPDVVAEISQALLAPAGTPDAIVERLSREVITILKRPDIVQKAQKMGLIIIGEGPLALEKRIVEEVPRWKEVIKEAKIKEAR